MEDHRIDQPDFHFERGRGIVWVCDLASSSKFLNDDSSAAAFEAFIPRFHWISRIVVRASGGDYIKWTGDGFLAWYPVPLHREVGACAAGVFNAAWHLTLLLNVTNFSVQTDKKFKIRHGVTYEQDGLITRLKKGVSESTDLLGRAVVLAFRLSGITARFPGIVTQGELVKASREHDRTHTTFKHWKPTIEERTRHFKGEHWGTSGLYRSVERQPRRKRPIAAVLRGAKKVVLRSKEDTPTTNTAGYSFAFTFLEEMMAGPEWSRETGAEYVRFIQDDLLGALDSLIPLVERADLKKDDKAP